jgi:hypothetical protein
MTISPDAPTTSADAPTTSADAPTISADAPAPAYRGGGGGKSTRDLMAALTHRVIGMALDELSTDQTRSYVKEQLVTPLFKMLMVECAPYAILFTSIIFAILLMSALTLFLAIHLFLQASRQKSHLFLQGVGRIV